MSKQCGFYDGDVSVFLDAEAFLLEALFHALKVVLADLATVEVKPGIVGRDS
jgi:hypothetical protein